MYQKNILLLNSIWCEHSEFISRLELKMQAHTLGSLIHNREKQELPTAHFVRQPFVPHDSFSCFYPCQCLCHNPDPLCSSHTPVCSSLSVELLTRERRIAGYFQSLSPCTLCRRIFIQSSETIQGPGKPVSRSIKISYQWHVLENWQKNGETRKSFLFSTGDLKLGVPLGETSSRFFHGGLAKYMQTLSGSPDRHFLQLLPVELEVIDGCKVTF